ncbi:MAG: hypothetical protein GQ574_12630 [Crocinitomix sp.]|nr:hypothetical protein [Crocinitomix sp.]
MKALELNTVESSELVEQTFRFWFTDQEHIRSPFPNYIRPNLQREATEKFFTWANNINPKAKDELNDEIIGEKFEEIIFETADKLVKTEDERITIQYPFLPRLGDQLKDPQQEGDSNVVDRIMLKEGDTSYLKVVLENSISKTPWETKFELPL